jgi:hypothetical protein
MGGCRPGAGRGCLLGYTRPAVARSPVPQSDPSPCIYPHSRAKRKPAVAAVQGLRYGRNVLRLPDPMLSRPGPLPSGSGWSYEVKWDGFRAIVSTEDGFRVRSRRGVFG